MRHGRELTELYEAAPKVMEELKKQGPLSSQDFDTEERVDWFWAPTRHCPGCPGDPIYLGRHNYLQQSWAEAGV